jgi:LppX_LprAFG lipoprotein
LIRLPRPALAIFAGLVVVFASACGSSAATPGAGGTTGPAGVSAAPAGATAAVANATDPSSIITNVLSSTQGTKSFHIKLEVSGTIKAAALNSAAGSAGSGPTSDVKLDGTAIEGDVDVANQAAHLSLTVAPIAMLGNVPITGDLILKDSALYYKVSLLGPKYTKTDLGSLTSLSPVAVPTPGASALAGVADQIAQLRQQLDAAGVKATLVGVEQIGGKDAYHISLSVPLDKLNAEIASAAASAAPGMKIDSASVDIWTYKDTNMLAKIQIAGASSSLGNLGITITVTNYGAPVTVTAPAASEIKPATP